MVQTRYHWSRCCKKVILKKHLHGLCSLSCIAKLLSSWLRIKVKDLRSVYTNDSPKHAHKPQWIYVNMKGYGLLQRFWRLSSTNFTWCNLEYFVPYDLVFSFILAYQWGVSLYPGVSVLYISMRFIYCLTLEELLLPHTLFYME